MAANGCLITCSAALEAAGGAKGPRLCNVHTLKYTYTYVVVFTLNYLKHLLMSLLSF